jgi:uncharacterized membrane protein (UPF0127 family)
VRALVLRNATQEIHIAGAVARASNALTRGIGLLGRGRVTSDEGLWIDNCAAVHTLGMRASLDLYFLDREQRVVRIVRNVRPNRLGVACRGAVSVVELGAATEDRRIAIGDRLELT